MFFLSCCLEHILTVNKKTPAELIGDTGQQTVHIDHDTEASSQNPGQVKAERPRCVSGHLPVQ